MDGLIREAVFGDAETQSRRPLAHLGNGPGPGHPAGLDPRALHWPAAAARSPSVVHRPGHEPAHAGLRFGPGRLPGRPEARRRRLHLRDRPERDRLHRPAAGRIRLGRPGRRHPGGIPRARSSSRATISRPSAKKYAADPEAEIKAIRDLIVEAVAAGFYNIDIDTSTLVDLSKPTLDEQQKLNFELCADFTRFIRGHEPKGVTISVGGEIGEVGQKNSTPEDLDAFMNGYNARRGAVTGHQQDQHPDRDEPRRGRPARRHAGPGGHRFRRPHGAQREGPQRIRHGRRRPARREHAARRRPSTSSSRPAPARSTWPRPSRPWSWTIRPSPRPSAQEMYEWLKANAADERKPKDTEAQFLYKARKKAVGPFKKKFWSLPADARAAIGASLEKTVRLPLRTAGDRRDAGDRRQIHRGARDPQAPSRGRRGRGQGRTRRRPGGLRGRNR